MSAAPVDDPDWQQIEALLVLQSGVISRRQALTSGLRDHDIRRLLRRRRWAPTGLPATYVDHTGPLTWVKRAWAAVLSLWPAALFGSSALRAADGPGRALHDDTGPIHVAIDRDRTVRQPKGVRVHRIADFEGKVQANASPPRQRVDEAVIDVAASAASELDAVAAVSDAVRARRTTAARMRAALAGRSRIARRSFLTALLDDVATGTCSVLEHGYLTLVERAHGLPVGERQVRASSHGPVYRDVDYEEFGLVVELDGTSATGCPSCPPDGGGSQSPDD